MLEQFYHGVEPTIMSSLAKAYFDNGSLPECLRLMKRLLHLEPHNKGHVFNLALTLQHTARNLLANERRSIPDVVEGIRLLHQAKRCALLYVSCSGCSVVRLCLLETVVLFSQQQ